ncbi:hypothetical protein EON65_51970 [archaeon]|nr:MAG: hypothetical protein EON65_51970 [archaeon]
MGNENSAGITEVEGEDEVEVTKPTFTNQAVMSSILSPLAEHFDPSKCTVRSLPKKICEWRGKGHSQFAVVVDNVLSEEECQRWIHETEQASRVDN